ncbi:hypothetical protein A8B78_01840 [Jannaschia sp. EhC01]|nr:hypothetical protein A8B78_01840 [Jannaschia sp. EhC01]
MTHKNRILLVGSSGRVGKLILPHLRAILPTSVSLIEQHRDPTRDTGLYWSLQESAPDGLSDLGIDAVICLAGVTPGSGADLSLNTPLALSVLRAAHEAGIPRVLLASSSAVYGAGDGTPLSETSPTAPVNPYGEAKLEMEDACAPWRGKGLEVCCLRIGNVAGADALLLNVAKSSGDEPLSIDCFDDGRGPVRSYIGVGTLAQVLYDLATQRSPLPEVLNIAAPGVVYMEDLAHAAGHPFDYRPAPAGAHQRITLDSSALAALHTIDADASDAAQMVVQWKEALSR